MLQLIARRFVSLLGVLLAVSALIFVVGTLLPTDAAQMRLNVYANEENLAILRAQMGLDQPLPLRYLHWIAGVVRGDFGTSLSFNSDITPLVLARAKASAVLAVLALLVSVPLALGLGLLSGLFRNRAPDYLMTAIGLFGISVPEFVIGLLGVMVFADWLGWFPAASITNGAAFADPAVLVLPVMTLAMLMLAQVARLTRSGVVQSLKQDFVRTARLKGISERQVALRHVFPNSVAPAISAIGLNFGWLFGSLAVVETLFSYQGLGDLIVFSVQNRDIPLLQASIFIVAIVVCLGNLLADLAIIALDPRQRRLGHGR